MKTIESRRNQRRKPASVQFTFFGNDVHLQIKLAYWGVLSLRVMFVVLIAALGRLLEFAIRSLTS